MTARPSSAHQNDGLPAWLASVLMKRGTAILPRFAYYRQRLARRPRHWRRRLRRQLAVTVTGAALLLAMSGASAQGDPVVPDNVITVVNGQVVVAANGQCSLNEAIQNANNKTNGRSHTDCAAGNPNGADTINLPTNGVFTLNSAFVPDAVAGPIGLPWIASTITINGNGSTIQRGINAPEFRVMAVGQQGNLTLNNTGVQNGYLYLDGQQYYGYHEGRAGAGILNQGQLTISGSRIVDNRTVSEDYGAEGGGIFNVGTLAITNSTIANNQVDVYLSATGGGIANIGVLTIVNSSIVGNTAYSEYMDTGGGGIDNSSSLTIIGSTIAGNTADSYRHSTGGGIISDWGSSLTIEQSTISGNAALAYRNAFGGGVGARGELVITNSIFYNNRASADYSVGGGGVESLGTASINGSSFSLNETFTWDSFNDDYGGAVSNFGRMTIANSTLSGNEATGRGGAIANYDNLMISNSTLSNNQAYDEGGAIANFSDLTVVNSTITGNSSGIYADCVYRYDENGTTFLRQTIVSGNNGNEILRKGIYNCSASVFADSYNLFGHSGNPGVTGFTPGPTDIVPSGNLASILSPLANNGGPTQTHALPANSPALDRAPNSSCTAAPVNGVDQRGEPRNQNGSGGASSNECDIGAFERQGGSPPPVGAFYISPAKAGSIGGVAFAPADIIKFDPATGWSMYFDGSDVGISKNVSAFEIQNDGSILLSLSAGQTVVGAGAVAPHDILRFAPGMTGNTTTGTFTLFVDGSNVGLTTAAEKIDALGLTADNRIAVSTTGAIAVAAPGGTLKGQDEDALGFNRNTVTWSPFFNGTAVAGLGVEDVNAIWVHPTTGEVYISILGGFNLGGVAGDGKDIVKLTPSGGSYTPSLYWDGSAAGLPVTIDAIEIVP